MKKKNNSPFWHMTLYLLNRTKLTRFHLDSARMWFLQGKEGDPARVPFTDLWSAADLSLLASELRNKRTQMFSHSTASRGLQTNPTVLLPTLSAKLEQKKARHFYHRQFLNTSPMSYVLIQCIHTALISFSLLKVKWETQLQSTILPPLHSAYGALADLCIWFEIYHIYLIFTYLVPRITTCALCYASFAFKY